MKILKLEFRNINSLRGSHEIDFTQAPFIGNSLFAITGPTGSGKSTILDVISLALFNRIPRLDKISTAEINKTGAIITRNQQEAMAAVTYECPNGTYRSEWSISTARTGNLRDYEMQISNAVTQELLPLRKSEVPQRNEQLISLNYNQFIKSVLLAQGEFAQFLRAKKDERGELLEKITGTGIYRQLGRAAFEKFREVNSEIELQQQHISQIKTKLLQQEQKGRIVTEQKEKEGVLLALEKEVAGLKKQLTIKEQVRKWAVEIKKLELEQSGAGEHLVTFEKDHGQPLLQHEMLRPHSENLRDWKRLKQELNLHRKELQVKKKEETACSEKLQECLQATAKFTRSEVTAANISQSLQEFRKKVANLQDTRRQKLELHRNFLTELKACIGEIDFPWKDDPGKQKHFLEDAKVASTTRLNKFKERLKVDLGKIEEEKQQLRERLQRVRGAQVASLQLESLKEDLLRKKSEAAVLVEKEMELPAREKALGLQVEHLGKDLEILQLKRENQLLLATMEEHRGRLREGEPCHLCGSRDHPYAVHLPQSEDSLDKDVQAVEQQLKELRHQLSSVTAQLEEIRRRLVEMRASVEVLEESLRTRSSQFQQEFGNLKADDSLSWETYSEDLEKLMMELEESEKEQRILKAVTAALPLHRELSKVLAEGVEIKNQLDKLYSGTDLHTDCEELQHHWLRCSEQQHFVKKRISELEKLAKGKQEGLDKIVVQLQPIEGLGFTSLEEATAALLPEFQYQDLQDKREKIKAVLSKLEASLKLLRSQYLSLKEEDVVETEEVLQGQLEIHTTQYSALKEDCEELRRVLKNDVELHRELKEVQGQIVEKEHKNKRWRLLNELIGDARGKKFNDFAQDLSLGQLLHLANLRLKSLSDRYRLDKPLGDEDDGLVAIDDHMGGQRRSVKTLSGGETFLLSLSLALALSDLASRNVEINSLFIDEGFGTLDPETLDQTLDTLEKLQAESQKTIGIISHVDSLKERIAIQVQLKRNGQGYSQLAIPLK